MTPPVRPLPSSALAALERGHKIDAIKQLREAQGIGLKEAKDEVEAYLNAHPHLQERFSAARAESGPRIGSWLLLIAIAALAAYLVFGRGA